MRTANEVLAEVLCYNIVVVGQTAHEFVIAPTFERPAMTA